ncbi:MAG: aminotransferase class IV [Prolixibacteraceae bacterium]|jgi:branched-chain amino acid aminotransferase|nr:aminotransferase class IV [Prolixibacteraceae bacterium]
MKGGYFLMNGRFHKESDAVFTVADIARRAEGFCESFRAEHNEIIFAESISNHLLDTAATIGADLTGLIDSDGRFLRREVSRLLNKNKLYLAAKIEIQIFPADSIVNMLLHVEEIPRGYYPLSESGLLLSIFRDQFQEIHSNSGYATSGFFVRNCASRKAKELNQPNIILLNREGHVCETLDGSFAMLNQDQVIFTSELEGGYNCAIRRHVIQSAKDAGFITVVKERISPDELLQAEELFLYDACYGIQKVLGLEDRRYFSTKTKLIAEKLSTLAQKDREERITN